MISFPLRTYLTNTFSFAIGVVVSYFLSRKIIFQLSYRDGSLYEFIKYISVSLINLGIPILVWFLINLWNPEFQKNELYYLLITVLIHGSILPIKYLIYKFFVFKDSL
jgi:putative flippase GtrA